MISNETLDTMMSVGGGIANLLIILLIVCAVFFGIILIFMIIWALVSWYLAVRRGVAERKDAIDERVLQLEQENSEFTTTLQYFRDLNLKIDVLMERTNYFQETVTKLLVEGNQVRYVEMPKEEEPEIQVLSVDEDDDEVKGPAIQTVSLDEDDDEVKGPAIQTVSLDEDDDEVKGPAIQTVSLDEDKPSNISRSNDDIQLNALLSEGRSCIREYRYIEAIDLFTKIIEINPSLSQAYNFRGIARRKLGELDLAIEDYNLALNINENYVEVLNNRGVALDKKGDHDSAISDFTKAINIDASNPHTYNNRATAYTNKGDYNMTLVDCTRAIQEDNKMADAYVNRGVAKVLLGLNEDAETDFEIAVSFGYDRSIVDSKIADLKNKNV
jgi:tetratricopeptide (TPR) repeat protein